MPRIERPNLRIRDAARGGLRGSVDVAGPRGNAGVNVEVGPDGVRGADGQVSVRGDGVDARAGVSVSPQGARGQASVRAGGPGGSVGLDAAVGADGLALRGDVQLGPARATLGRNAAGRATGALDVGGALADGLDVRLHLGKAEDATLLRAGGTLRLSRWLALPDVKLDVATTARDPQPVAPDASALGQVRARMLAARPGAHYQRRTTLRALDAGAERGLWAALGGLKLGFALHKEVEVTETRLVEGGPLRELRADADGLAALLPGEGLSLVGHARVRLASDGNAQLSPLSARIGASVGLRGAALRAGRVAIAVEREEGSFARVTLRGEESRDASSGQSVEAGARLPLPEAKLGNLAADVALDYAHARARAWLDALAPLRASRETSSQEGDAVVRELRVDLALPEVREALDLALLGDWSALEARVGSAGVSALEDARGVHESQRETHALRAFGFSRAREEVVTESERLETRPDETLRVADRSFQRSERWQGFGVGGSRTAGLIETERERTPQAAGEASLVRRESALEWSAERRLRRAAAGHSVELARARGLAELLGDEDAHAALAPGAAAPHDGRGTQTLRISLRVDDDGLARASRLSPDALWEHAGAAWRAAHPGEEVPLWARPGGRASLEEHGPLRHGHADYAPYHEVRELIDTLAQQAGRPGHEGMRALYELLEARAQDPFWLAFLASAVGQEHARLQVGVTTGA